MGSPFEMKQTCISLSDAALALFDFIDAEGIDAPVDGYEGIEKLKAVLDTTEDIRKYYVLRNIQRMLSLGISPSDFIEKPKE
jgi:hypothetical protein